MLNPVCRTCLKTVQDSTQCQQLDHPQQKVGLKTKLEACMPELKLNCVRNSIMCNSCVDALNSAYDFKVRCYETETKISRFMASSTAEEIDLDIITAAAINGIATENKDVVLPNDSSIRCLACNKWLNSVDVFKKHINTHMTELSCSKCNYQTNSQDLLDKHVKLHTSNPSKLFKCSSCDYNTTDKNAFVEHRASHTGSKVHLCDQCDFRTTVAFNFRRHLKVHEVKSVLKCSLCSFKTSTQLDYDMHVKTHAEKEKFTCQHCSYSTVKPQNLRKHVSRNHKNVTKKKNSLFNANTYQFTLEDIAFILECDNVEELFKEGDEPKAKEDDYMITEDDVIDALNLTYLKDTGVFPCPACKASFKYKYLLNRHMMEHNDNEQVFKCRECDFSDTKKGNFKLHMRTHTGGKVYTCEKCDYRTLYYSTYQKHRNVHDKQDKVKRCNACDFKTTIDEELQIHKMTHIETGPSLRCGECQFETGDEEEMKVHLNMHVIGNQFIDNSFHQHFLPSDFIN